MVLYDKTEEHSEMSSVVIKLSVENQTHFSIFPLDMFFKSHNRCIIKVRTLQSGFIHGFLFGATFAFS